MKNKRFLIFPLILLITIFQLVGCTYRTTLNGVDTKNSTKVSKVEFVKEYASNYKDEEVVSSYKNTKALYARVYFKDVPEDTTKIVFTWKVKNSGQVIDTVDTTVSQSESREPMPSYIESSNGALPDGTYILETYLKDTNDLLNTTEIQISK